MLPKVSYLWGAYAGCRFLAAVALAAFALL